MTPHQTPAAATDDARLRKIAFAAFVGTALEMYDFLLFGMTAAIVIAPVFFPGGDPYLSTLSSFLAFGAGFIARPLGAIFFGHLGDRHGRRLTLVLTILLMGLASTLIGLLPSYASAGLIAPLLLVLLRSIQGIAAGGEWSGATLLVVENAAPGRRGFYASIVQLGAPAGTILSSGAVALVTLLPQEDLLSWGWRIPYLASVLLIAVALWLRWGIEETPVFQELSARKQVEKAPILELLKTAWRRLLVAAALYLYAVAGYFIFTVFMISYATSALQIEPSLILRAFTIGAFGQIIGLLLSGRLSDRLGAGPTVILGAVFPVLTAFPLFWAVNTGSAWVITLAYLALMGCTTIAYGPIGAVISELFPDRLHYSGLAISTTLAGLIGGFMPLLAAMIFKATGNHYGGPASLLLAIALISLFGAIAAHALNTRARKSRLSPPPSID